MKNTITFEIERSIGLESLLDGIITAEQQEALAEYMPEYDYTVEVSVDRDDEIEAGWFDDDMISVLMMKLALALPGMTPEITLDVWQAIRTSEDNWFVDGLQVEAWEHYRSWCDAQEENRWEAQAEERRMAAD